MTAEKKRMLSAIFVSYIVFMLGWFYNAFSTIVKEKYANVLSAAMFVFIHYPRWFQLERPWGDIVYGSIYVFVLGILLGIVFRKNHSIWTPAILHSIWDSLGFLI